MGKRYIKSVLVTEAEETRVYLDNGDTLDGLEMIRFLGPVEPNWLPKVELRALITWGDESDG